MKTYENEKEEFEEKSDQFADAAFPAHFEVQYQSNPNIKYSAFSKGLSKREYFAAMAMQTLILRWQESGEAYADKVSEMSLEYADALIKALNQSSQEKESV